MAQTPRRTYRARLKLETVLEALCGQQTTAQICRERDITAKLFYRWKTTVLERAPRLFEQPGNADTSETQARIAELERMVGRLTMELEILKQAGELWTSRSTKNGR